MFHIRDLIVQFSENVTCMKNWVVIDLPARMILSCGYSTLVDRAMLYYGFIEAIRTPTTLKCSIS